MQARVFHRQQVVAGGHARAALVHHLGRCMRGQQGLELGPEHLQLPDIKPELAKAIA